MGYVEMEITSFNNDGPLLEINVIYFDLMGYVWFMQIPGPVLGTILITILFWNNDTCSMKFREPVLMKK
jgi:hypothetical protein